MSEEKLEFKRGSAKFIMGIDTVAQLEHWLLSNPLAVGFALVGRSNVGKSTLINSLLGNKTARTSKTPGRTRQINIFEFEINGANQEEGSLFYLFDLPGYGHAEISKAMAKNWNELLQCFFEYSSKNTLIVNIQDARHPNQQVDQDFKDFIKNFDHDTMLVFNKLDKLKTQKERASLDKLKPFLIKTYKNVHSIYFVSAEDKKNLPQLEMSLINYLVHKKNLFLFKES